MRIFFTSIALLLLAGESAAFVAPQPRVGTRHHETVPSKVAFPTHRSSISTQLYSSVDTQQLTTFFLESVISNGVPALFTIMVIAFAANAFRPKKDPDAGRNNNPIAELYSDLYGTGDRDGRNRPFFNKFLGGRPGSLVQNTGVPSQQFIRIDNVNSRLDSYQYSMTAATQSKASAAAQARSRNFERALQLGFGSSLSDLPASAKTELLQTEQDFLKRASEIQSTITSLQATLTKTAIDDEMKVLGVTSTDMDPHVSNTTESNVTRATSGLTFQMPLYGNKNSKQLKQVTSLQENLMKLELNFIQDVISILGPERANGVKAALLGDVASRGAGGLLTQLQDRPLTVLLKESEAGGERRKSLFVTEFPGDATASQVAELREEITAIVRNAKPGDEAMVVLQTGGGTVTGYGLAAAQLKRFKENGMNLTICVEQVAASGGYMMACIADRIIASPFAVLGSIGVISDIPNVYERLKEEGIEFQTVTAGKYKRTLTPTKKVTSEDMKKSKQDIEEVLKLFKGFVKENRPSLDIEKVATGETWFGTDALERGLCDEINTVDDVVTNYVDSGFNVFKVKYEPPPEMEFSRFLLPVGASGEENRGFLSKAVRWLARTVASEFKSELNDVMSSSQRADRKYMMKDDASDRIRID